MIPISEAFRLILESTRSLEPETVSIGDSVGRVLAAEVRADIDSPPHDKSMMDGFAVRSSDINSGVKKLEVVETIAAGAWPQKSIGPGEASRIMTGAPMPEGADAVVMIELTETDDDYQTVTVTVDALNPGQHRMLQHTNFKTGDSLFTAGHAIRAIDIGLLAECGASQLKVNPKIEVAILPTGDELVDCSQRPGRGQIRNSNGPMLVAMAGDLNLDVENLGIGRDKESELAEKVARGLKADVLILTGGVSMGEFDLVPGILAKSGVQQVFHKVAVKPGKPIWFGVLDHASGKRTLVFGLPGNPVSSLVGFHLFVRTAIRKLASAAHELPMGIPAVLATDHQTRGNRPTYWPGRWLREDSTTRKVQPVIWRGSSDLVALGLAEVLIKFSVERADHPVGEVVEVFELGT